MRKHTPFSNLLLLVNMRAIQHDRLFLPFANFVYKFDSRNRRELQLNHLQESLSATVKRNVFYSSPHFLST